jgi:SAM-dependent methyltransferase
VSTHNRPRHSETMRRDWNRRASADVLYAIDADRGNRTIDDFFAGGPALVQGIVDPALETLGVDPSGLRVLEIGCGIGRLFAGLADRFGEVWGIDISQAMITQGQQSCPATATWLVGDGETLAGVDDASVDHVLCYEVFIHVPQIDITRAYLEEIRRVLRPGATFQAHLRRGSDSFRQSIVRALPRPLRVLSGAFLRAIGVMPVLGDIDTWLGTLVTPDEAVAMAKESGFVDIAALSDDFNGVHDPKSRGVYFWLVGRRPID